MTRETKIGLIVAGSFLCLVCIVIASKWRRGDDPSKEPEGQTVPVAAVKPTQSTKTPQAKTKDEGQSDGPTSPVALIKLPSPPESGNGAPGDNKSIIPAPTPLNLPPQLNEKDRMELEARKQEKEALASLQSAPGHDSLPMPLDTGTINFPPLPPGDGVIPQPGVGGLKAVPPPILPGQDGDQKPLIPLDKAVLDGFPPPVPLAALQEKKTAAPDLPKPGNVSPLVTPSPNGERSDSLPEALKRPTNPSGQSPDNPLVFPPPNPKETSRAIVPVNEKDQPPNKDGISAPPLTAFPKEPVMPANPSEAPTVSPNPIARIGGDGTPSAPPITIAPGFGGIKPLPPVKDVNNSYVCQSGDTNFATLSTRLYGTPKYADALLAYNRDHARWIKNGSAFLASSPSLTPGQQVEYPPIEILERSYLSLIREASVNPIPSIPGAPLVKLATPAPLNPGIATISNPPAAGQTRNYKVQNPSGESILDIAERMLGNRSLWTEIYRINQTNPAVRPPAAIPVGTDLKLPAN
jgi:hypothetical protein